MFTGFKEEIVLNNKSAIDGGIAVRQAVHAGMPADKAILVVSFGTTYPDTLRLNIESIEKKIRDAFPGYEVRRAFTSRIVIQKLAKRDRIVIDTEKQALERLKAEGYREVYIQPLHVVAGEEYDKIKNMVAYYALQKVFDEIVMGRPLLYYMGQEGKPDDYLAALAAVKTQLPPLGRNEAVLFMGHGGVHPANAAYAALQLKMGEAGFNNVFIYTAEGFPALDGIMAQLKRRQVEKVTLMPFMLVAGDHVHNDMAGDEDGSAKSQLRKAGFEVAADMRGLGENAAIRDIYLKHLKEAMIQADCT